MTTSATPRPGTRSKPDPKVVHWRTQTPVRALSHGVRLRIVGEAPFVLHYSGDGWTTAHDPASTPLPFGLHAATPEIARTATRLVFTRGIEDVWEDRNHDIDLEAPAVPPS